MNLFMLINLSKYGITQSIKDPFVISVLTLFVIMDILVFLLYKYTSLRYKNFIIRFISMKLFCNVVIAL